MATSIPRESGAHTTKPPDEAGKDLRSTPRPFSVFGKKRWRPALEQPGSLNDMAAYALFLLLPAVSGAVLWRLAMRRRFLSRPVTWARLVTGNLLILVFLLSLALLLGETWFRFFYDTTDSLAFTRVTEQWVRRHWHVNSAGCRDNVEYVPGLAAGQRRLTFIGDSFTAGHGVKNVEDRMANRLRARYPGAQVHVIANIGLDTGTELVVIRRLLKQGYQLDRVVLVYCLNDIGDLAPHQIEAFQSVFSNVLNEGWLIQNSFLLNLLYERFQVWRNPYARNYSGYIQGMYDDGPLWDAQRARLKALRDLVASNGGKLAVVTFPLFHAVGPDYPYAAAHEKLARFWLELRVPHLDLLPVFASLPARKLVVNPYDAHPNEFANQLAAEAAGEFLFGQGKVVPPGEDTPGAQSKEP